jgi:hypothetical protein
MPVTSEDRETPVVDVFTYVRLLQVEAEDLEWFLKRGRRRAAREVLKESERLCKKIKKSLRKKKRK